MIRGGPVGPPRTRSPRGHEYYFLAALLAAFLAGALFTAFLTAFLAAFLAGAFFTAFLTAFLAAFLAGAFLTAFFAAIATFPPWDSTLNQLGARIRHLDEPQTTAPH